MKWDPILVILDEWWSKNSLIRYGIIHEKILINQISTEFGPNHKSQESERVFRLWQLHFNLNGMLMSNQLDYFAHTTDTVRMNDLNRKVTLWWVYFLSQTIILNIIGWSSGRLHEFIFILFFKSKIPSVGDALLALISWVVPLVLLYCTLSVFWFAKRELKNKQIFIFFKQFTIHIIKFFKLMIKFDVFLLKKLIFWSLCFEKQLSFWDGGSIY